MVHIDPQMQLLLDLLQWEKRLDFLYDHPIYVWVRVAGSDSIYVHSRHELWEWIGFQIITLPIDKKYHDINEMVVSPDEATREMGWHILNKIHNPKRNASKQKKRKEEKGN